MTQNAKLREAAQAYVDAVNGEPEKDCWDTEDGMEEPGAEKFASDCSWEAYDDKKQKAFDALRAALISVADPAEAVQPVGGAVVPEGWQLVPKELTDAMQVEINLTGTFARKAMQARYAAMLAAAPALSQPQLPESGESAEGGDCQECGGTGMRDTGGVHPWGEHISVPCDCKERP